ncbi:hypothetical protein ACH5RR_033238 [Cinchona calisaya]|uniref:Uncharacterized protein n=1 Tax=Cinchona calisaya TaxID=153742 RepID=A0ABD2YLQ1_9GENT
MIRLEEEEKEKGNKSQKELEERKKKKKKKKMMMKKNMNKKKKKGGRKKEAESDVVTISIPFPLIEGKPQSRLAGATVVDSITIEDKTSNPPISAVHFSVENDTIERLAFIMAEDNISQSLASGKLFNRFRKKRQSIVGLAKRRPLLVYEDSVLARLSREDQPLQVRTLDRAFVEYWLKKVEIEINFNYEKIK